MVKKSQSILFVILQLHAVAWLNLGFSYGMDEILSPILYMANYGKTHRKFQQQI